MSSMQDCWMGTDNRGKMSTLPQEVKVAAIVPFIFMILFSCVAVSVQVPILSLLLTTLPCFQHQPSPDWYSQENNFLFLILFSFKNCIISK